MERPSDWEEVSVNEGFERIEEGGHYAVIKQVTAKKNKNDKDMIVILFDFADNDKQKGYFMKRFNEDTRPDKKYPNDATNYMTIDKSESYGTKNLKSLVTMVENSNTGFKVQWGGDTATWCKQFVGKKIGCVFGKVLDFYNGEEHKKVGFRWFCSSTKVAEQKIPDEYETKAHKDNAKNISIANESSFMQIPDGIEDSLPFN